jgi:rRNA-processing protein FCF1
MFLKGMKQILLDTNFIISCIKNKIDFFYELLGSQILIPKQVINEIQRIKNVNSNLALQLLKKNKFKEINLGRGHVDKKIIQYAKNNPSMIIATLDRGIHSKIQNKKLIILGKKKLEIQ